MYDSYVKRFKVNIQKSNVLRFKAHLLRMGWRNIFSSCAVVSVFWFLAGNRFLFYILMYLEYNTVVVLCQFFGSGGKQFWCYVRTQCTIQLCGCVSFLVVAGNCSLNENTFLQKNLIGLLFMIRQPMCVFHKT